jgi:hypothetical protein
LVSGPAIRLNSLPDRFSDPYCVKFSEAGAVVVRIGAKTSILPAPVPPTAPEIWNG